ncbi:uncharacterized protein LOC126324493 [Schistocerca gregaria]|uniref:uncharacterized protein LOC126324493 n=1 Tax=Schistocerca gregaria TaxID=7010 RepID=UPI00211E6429|nr:uncharacterized protein LOC126324493 [Schistocerca gregaria]
MDHSAGLIQENSFIERALRLVFMTASAATRQADSYLPSKKGYNEGKGAGPDAESEVPEFGMISLNQRRQHIFRAYQTRLPPPGEKTASNPGKHEDMCRDIREATNLNIRDGFRFEFERQLSNAFGMAHQFSMGQQQQQNMGGQQEMQREPPSSYCFMTHYTSPAFGIFISRLSTSGEIMARWIKEGKQVTGHVSYQERAVQKGTESSFEAELIKPRKDSTLTGKLIFQSTPQGSGPALGLSFAKSLTPNLMAGLETFFYPNGSFSYFTARYDRSLLEEHEVEDANSLHKTVTHHIETLDEQRVISELEMVKLSNALFEPREAYCFQAQSTSNYEFSYIRHISRIFTLVTSLSLSNMPQLKSPYFVPSWNLCLQYNADPAIFSASICNLKTLSCLMVHAINDYMSLELCGLIDYAKDAYKFGFGLIMRL